MLGLRAEQLAVARVVLKDEFGAALVALAAVAAVLLRFHRPARQRMANADGAARIARADVEVALGVRLIDAADGDAARDCRVVWAAVEQVARDGWHEHAHLRRGLKHKVGAAGVHAALAAAVPLRVGRRVDGGGGAVAGGEARALPVALAA